MHSFTAIGGQVWHIGLNIAAIRQIKKELDIDLLDISDGRILARLADDPETLCNLLWVLVSDQAQEVKVEEVMFARSLGGDVIADATSALLKALVDFFPNPRRQVLARMLEKTRALEQTIADKLMARLDDPALEANLEDLLNSGLASGKTRASSASDRKRSGR